MSSQQSLETAVAPNPAAIPNPGVIPSAAVVPISSFSQILTFLAVTILAISAISEIAARESVLSLLTGQISDLRSEYVQQSQGRPLSDVLAGAKPSAAYSGPSDFQRQPSAPQTSASSTSDLGVLISQINEAEYLKRQLQTLIALGADDPSYTLRAIQKKFTTFIAYTTKSAAAEELSPSIDGTTQRIFSTIGAFCSRLVMLSSDQLLAVSVMGCGAIGAMVGSLRGAAKVTLRSFCLGLASGFIAYLAIKGGKHLFLLQSQDEVAAFNPYGSAFAGLLAGLFTEKAYMLLGLIVDDFAARLHAAASHGGKGGQGGQQS